MHTVSLLAAGASLLSLASAHGFVRGITVNNNKATWVPGADPVWFYHPAGSAPVTAGWNVLNQDLGFVEPANFGGNDLACHKSAKPSGNLAVKANAGDTLTFYWSGWPDSHKGPIINYLAPVSSFSGASASALRFTKFNQAAWISGDQWVTDTLIKQNYTSQVRIPPQLKAGNYVVRHEIIALHGAQSDNGAQAYPQCINVQVGGSGTVSPPGGVAGNQLYKRNEVGIVFNIWQNLKSYPIPGPALWTGAN